MSAEPEPAALTPSPHLLIYGMGYSARAVAALAVAHGYRVTGTSRRSDTPPPGVRLIHPDAVADYLPDATHLLAGAPPDEAGDPWIAAAGDALHASRPRWIGYFSTTGVYGDRQGCWVDETSMPAPTGPRGQRRLAAERQWTVLAAAVGARLDLLRIAGIYGPGRSAFESLRSGGGRRVLAPGHAFGRIHRDDIAGATLAAMQSDEPGLRVLNLSDDEPEESAVVTATAARLLGVEPPPLVPLAEALETMSPMGRSFWKENRKVSSRLTQTTLGRSWQYPSYREGLAQILGTLQTNSSGQSG